MSEKEQKIIEKNHFKYDPFYRLLFDTDCTFDDNKNVKIIDELLMTGINIIYKKYGQTIQQNTHINVIFTLFQTSLNKYNKHSPEIKLFILLTMIAHEPELANCIEKLYDTKGGLFEEHGPRLYRKTIILIKENIRKTFEFPYNIANIVGMIDNFISSIRLKYACG